MREIGKPAQKTGELGFRDVISATKTDTRGTGRGRAGPAKVNSGIKL